jgi:hypothetical protein
VSDPGRLIRHHRQDNGIAAADRVGGETIGVRTAGRRPASKIVQTFAALLIDA